MIEEMITDSERAFLSELERHENKWVALVRDGADEKIVASGDDAVAAKTEAQKNGVKEPILYWVGTFDRGYIPFND
jgi:hypothetical protein